MLISINGKEPLTYDDKDCNYFVELMEMDGQDCIDELGLPDVDPAVPPPDFFDEAVASAVAFKDVLVGENVALTPPPASALLIGAGDASILAQNPEDENEDIQKLLESSVNENENDYVPGHEFEDLIVVPAEAITLQNVIIEVPNNVEEEKAEDNDNGEVGEEGGQTLEMKEDAVTANAEEVGEDNDDIYKSSGPDTPLSKNGSTATTTVHLMKLPKPMISAKKISIPSESPPKRTMAARSLRSTRSNKLSFSPTEGRGGVKRKINSGSEDESESEQNSNSDDANSDSDERVGTVRDKRQVKKPGRYNSTSGSEVEEVAENVNNDDDRLSDAEDLFVPVRKKLKLGNNKGNVWRDGSKVYFDDGSGDIVVLKECSVNVLRLTREEIEYAIRGIKKDRSGHLPVLLEVCVDNFQSAVEAVVGGAKRIELCSSLAEGGLTPSAGFLTLLKKTFPNITVFAMIRPRGGDFLYNPDEIEMMTRDISSLKKAGANGFVFGVLKPNGEVDKTNCKRLKRAAYPLPCTFHRAFDKVVDPYQALEEVIDLGFQRILTSGLQATALAGIDTLKRLVNEAGGRIIILAGAGINENNVSEIVKKTGVREVHGSASKPIKSLMMSKSDSKIRGRGGRFSGTASKVKMGATDDDIIKVTDSKTVRNIVVNASKHLRYK